MIIEGIKKNPKSRIECMGLRFNFLTALGMEKFVDLSKGTPLKEIFIRNNSINENGVYRLDKYVTEVGSKLIVDVFEILSYQEKMERTVWIFPFNRTPEEYKRFFESSECGIVTDVRTRKGMQYPGKTMQNQYGFVEFAHPDSVKRALAKAAKREAKIGSANIKIYKAGTGTFIYIKKS